MKNLSNILLEKLVINKNYKQDKYEFCNAKNLEELKNFIHNDWDGESSFRISNKISDDDLERLCDYCDELDANEGEPGRAQYWYEKYKDDETLFVVKLREK